MAPEGWTPLGRGFCGDQDGRVPKDSQRALRDQRASFKIKSGPSKRGLQRVLDTKKKYWKGNLDTV